MAMFAEFVLSAVAPRQFPTDGLPEIALAGRSNVGKSSLINSLLRMNKLARTSNTPGRTQTLNYYRIWPEGRPRFGDPEASAGAGDRFTLRGSALEAAQAAGAFYFVDMPGYGFARVAESQRMAWRKLIDQYLLRRETLRSVIQIVDLRHPPSKDDVAMWEWLVHHDKPRLCVATKADKVPRPQRPAHVKEVALHLGLPTDQVVVFSADEGLGRDPLWAMILRAINASVDPE